MKIWFSLTFNGVLSCLDKQRAPNEVLKENSDELDDTVEKKSNKKIRKRKLTKNPLLKKKKRHKKLKKVLLNHDNDENETQKKMDTDVKRTAKSLAKKRKKLTQSKHLSS